ncbi:predicted protein [Naegleria gruberi]|uniref:Predicted protein n=1 Tax=Naegleria gruberi TaxID=5762 RepID=D2VXE1_NAEGR|nr:uncharacterized protein NAEGRDRAFT_73714 [Naegleria gruberi]EFC38423.1 predicted protein [Naegleria gruberi]|eukprot:XP_002671167.1 predicted protein [Naegleria gruberi strain NEG-M]
MAICREFNYLVTGSHDSLEIYDLITHQPIQETIHFSEGIYGIDFERENSGQWNLILSTWNNYFVKYDFNRILSEKSFGEPIFKVPIKFAWAVRCFKTELYVIDYDSKIFVFDLKSGLEKTEITVGLEDEMVDMVFTPEEEMIVCGSNQWHILKFNENSSCWEKIKSYSNENGPVRINRCFGVWYERKTKLIYLTDNGGKIFIFDRELNLVKEIKVSGLYEIVINEQNGEMFVCDKDKNQLIIYK